MKKGWRATILVKNTKTTKNDYYQGKQRERNGCLVKIIVGDQRIHLNNLIMKRSGFIKYYINGVKIEQKKNWITV